MNIHEETTWREGGGAVRVVTNLLVHAETVEVFDSSLRGDLSVDWQLHWVEDWVVLVAWEEASRYICQRRDRRRRRRGRRRGRGLCTM